MHSNSNSLQNKCTLNVESATLNVEPATLNVELATLNVEPHSLKCPTCYKTFRRKRYLAVHEKVCTHLMNKHECSKCHLVCASSSALSHHKVRCKENNTLHTCHNKYENMDPLDSKSGYSVQQHANTINNHNNTYIIEFPSEGDPDYKFIRDHLKKLEYYFGKVQPDVGFRKYVNAFLERAENRMIYKSNPNTKYCKVYRNGQWEIELDKDAMPVLTNQLSISALEDINDYRDKVQRTKLDIANILRYLEDVNTENDANSNYKDAEERIKLIIINMSKRWGLPAIIPET